MSHCEDGSVTPLNMYLFFMIVFHCLSNLPIEQSLYRGIHARFWMQVRSRDAVVHCISLQNSFLWRCSRTRLRPCLSALALCMQ